jgi:hypothetical protein
MEILRRRRVRFVVAWYSLVLFAGVAQTLERPPLLTERGLLPAARRTLFWKLRYDTLPGFRLVAEGPLIQRARGDPPEPIYRIFEVRP